MHAGIAQRLTATLERRYAALRQAWEPWGDTTEAREAAVVELVAYACLYREEPHLAGLFRLLEARAQADDAFLARRASGWLVQLQSIDPRRAETVAPTWPSGKANAVLRCLRDRSLEGFVPSDAERDLLEAVSAWSDLFQVQTSARPTAGWKVLVDVLAGSEGMDRYHHRRIVDAVQQGSGKGEPPLGGRQLAEVGRLHDWVLDRLASGVAAESAIDRYKQSRERFARSTLRNQLLAAKEGRPDNPDERLACELLSLYLHDQGFDPWTEVQLGNGRADIVATGADALAVEAKVVRVGDTVPKAEARLGVGATQARHYAQRCGLDTGFLVVFWLADHIWHSLPQVLVHSDVRVRVVVIDLGNDPPSRSSAAKLVSLPGQIDRDAVER